MIFLLPGNHDGLSSIKSALQERELRMMGQLNEDLGEMRRELAQLINIEEAAATGGGVGTGLSRGPGAVPLRSGWLNTPGARVDQRPVAEDLDDDMAGDLGVASPAGLAGYSLADTYDPALGAEPPGMLALVKELQAVEVRLESLLQSIGAEQSVGMGRSLGENAWDGASGNAPSNFQFFGNGAVGGNDQASIVGGIPGQTPSPARATDGSSPSGQPFGVSGQPFGSSNQAALPGDTNAGARAGASSNIPSSTTPNAPPSSEGLSNLPPLGKNPSNAEIKQFVSQTYDMFPQFKQIYEGKLGLSKDQALAFMFADMSRESGTTKAGGKTWQMDYETGQGGPGNAWGPFQAAVTNFRGGGYDKDILNRSGLPTPDIADFKNPAVSTFAGMKRLAEGVLESAQNMGAGRSAQDYLMGAMAHHNTGNSLDGLQAHWLKFYGEEAMRFAKGFLKGDNLVNNKVFEDKEVDPDIGAPAPDHV